MSKVEDFIGDKKWMSEIGRPDDQDWRIALEFIQQLQEELKIKISQTKQLEEKIQQLQAENKRQKELMQEIIESPPCQHVPNWVVFKLEHALKGK